MDTSLAPPGGLRPTKPVCDPTPAERFLERGRHAARFEKNRKTGLPGIWGRRHGDDAVGMW